MTIKQGFQKNIFLLLYPKYPFQLNMHNSSSFFCTFSHFLVSHYLFPFLSIAPTLSLSKPLSFFLFPIPDTLSLSLSNTHPPTLSPLCITLSLSLSPSPFLLPSLPLSLFLNHYLYRYLSPVRWLPTKWPQKLPCTVNRNDNHIEGSQRFSIPSVSLKAVKLVSLTGALVAVDQSPCSLRFSTV